MQHEVREPLWPGFSPRALAVTDPLGADAAIDDPAAPRDPAPRGTPEVELLHRAFAAIHPGVDAPSAVRSALREALAATGATSGSLWIFQGDGSIVRAAHAGLSREYLQAYARTADWRKVQREVGLAPDVAIHDGPPVQLPDDQRAIKPMLAIESLAMIPLRTRGLRMGSLVLGHGQPGWFRAYSLEFLRTLGELIAAALDNARLLAEVNAAGELHAELLRSAHDAIVFCDTARRVTEVNPAFERLVGRPRPELIGLDLFALAEFSDPEEGAVGFRRIIESGAPLVGDRCELRHRDGSRVPAVANGARVADSGGCTRGAILVLRDDREVRAAEARERETYAILERMLATLDVGVALFAAGDCAVLEHNPAFARLVAPGQSEAALRGSIRERLPADVVAVLTAALQRADHESRRVSLTDVEVRWPDREPNWWNVAVAPLAAPGERGGVRIVMTVTDVTERRHLEDRYRHAQKMEAVGTLAGGVAHEFNNLLTAILGQVSLALFDLPPEHALVPGLRDCETAALRAAELTRQLLGFGRRSPVRLRPTDLRQVIEESLPLFRHAIDPRIEVEREAAGDLWEVQADSAQIGQALMNLCVNARDALPSGGCIRITLRNAHVESTAAPRRGEFVVLEVADDGAGMSNEGMARMDEPFFTTKGPDRGTGLGLAVVHGIVEQHGGWIECDSLPGRGTTFRIHLPRAVPAGSALRAPAGRGETVLVVDDEESLRALARAVLERNGYRVLLASDGVEALQVFREQHAGIDVVLLDRTMPRLSGRDALAEMRAISPGVRVILTSGFAGPDGGPGEPSPGFLPKPYLPEQVAAAVRAALDSRP